MDYANKINKRRRFCLFSTVVDSYIETWISIGPGFFQPLALVWFLHTNLQTSKLKEKT